MSPHTEDIQQLCHFAAFDARHYQTFEMRPFEAAPASVGVAAISRVAQVTEVLPLSSSPRIAPQLTLLGTAGGVGTTTILVTLARLWSAKGAIDLADVTSPSSLPLHLGGNGLVEGMWSLRPRNAAANPGSSGTIRVIAGHANALKESSAGHPTVLDAGNLTASEAVQMGNARTTYLVIAAPDMSSRGRLPKLVAQLQGAGAEVKVLLNRNENGTMAGDRIFKDFQELLGETLLPIAIRRTDLIPQAFERGETVVDSAPDSECAAEFRVLAEWLSPLISRRMHD